MADSLRSAVMMAQAEEKVLQEFSLLCSNLELARKMVSDYERERVEAMIELKANYELTNVDLARLSGLSVERVGELIRNYRLKHSQRDE